MESLILPELGLDCRFSSKARVQKPIARFLVDVSKIQSDSEKILKLDDLENQLQDEMKKIEAFKRELPLCMLLLNDAIVTVEEELAQIKKSNSEPVLEEFIPLKKTCTDEKEDNTEGSNGKENSCRDKMNWMSSVQLWNSDNNPSNPNSDFSTNKLSVKVDNNKKGKEEERTRLVMDNLFQIEKNREVGKAFLPFKGCSNFSVMDMGKKDMDDLPVPGLSLCTPGIKNSKEGVDHPIGFSSKPCYSRSTSSSATNTVQSNFKAGLQQQAGRKQRRCWSAELHSQFINALEHLGGPQVATPKQIREHMQVDGLTNDEVKSHLQKYRLHMKRVASNSNSKAVGFWASQGECVKQRLSQSGSPEGPLQFEGDDCIDDEDDAKSESSF